MRTERTVRTTGKWRSVSSRLPSRVFSEAAVVVQRLAVSSKLALLLVDRVLLTATPLDDADEDDDEEQERDDAHHADEPAGRRLERFFHHYSTAGHTPRTSIDILQVKVTVFTQRSFCSTSYSMRSGMDHTVLPANYTMPALPRKRSPDGATTSLSWNPSNYRLLLIYRPRKKERLSWPSWLTYRGRFTHIGLSGHPPAEVGK